jgi:zinc protease
MALSSLWPFTRKKLTVIQFERFELANGLKVLVHEDHDTPMAALNVLYNVGSRDENPDRTGFAHLFEHLMFGGSANIPDFDAPLQMAGGENNAFTNTDYTNFYEVLPAQNLETAFWLESDRMLSLNFSKKSLEVQRKVVVEEFKETCLNQPYGDMWHHLSKLAYQQHPYRWPVIGLVPEHVEAATLNDVKKFFFNHYRPNNAILVVAGKVKTEEVKVLAEKWFGAIPAGLVPERKLAVEPVQTEFRELSLDSPVPLDALYLGFPCPERLSPDYYAMDLLSDVLGNGSSSRLFRRLLKEKQLFSSIDCYHSGTLDPGLFIIEGRPAGGVNIADAEAAIWAEIQDLIDHGVGENELQKCKNRAESALVFSELSILSKAMSLAIYELLGDANMLNEEPEKYAQVSTDDVQRMAATLLTKNRCNRLIYKSMGPEHVASFVGAEEDDEDEGDLFYFN